MKRPSGKTIVKYIPAAITLICTLAGILYILIKGKIETESLLDFVRAHDTIAVPVILFLFALKGVLVVLPYSLLTTVTGLLFDFVPALLINLTGTVLCMTVPYLTGKSAKREDVLEKSGTTGFFPNIIPAKRQTSSPSVLPSASPACRARCSASSSGTSECPSSPISPRACSESSH